MANVRQSSGFRARARRFLTGGSSWKERLLRFGIGLGIAGATYAGTAELARRIYKSVPQKKVALWYGFTYHSRQESADYIKNLIKNAARDGKPFHIVAREDPRVNIRDFETATRSLTDSAKSRYDTIAEQARREGRSFEEVDAEVTKIEISLGMSPIDLYDYEIAKTAARHGLVSIPAEAYSDAEHKKVTNVLVDLLSANRRMEAQMTIANKLPHFETVLRKFASLMQIRNRHVRATIDDKIRRTLDLYPHLKKLEEVRVLVVFGGVHYTGIVAVNPKQFFEHPDMEIQAIRPQIFPSFQTMLMNKLEANPRYKPTKPELKKAFISQLLDLVTGETHIPLSQYYKQCRRLNDMSNEELQNLEKNLEYKTRQQQLEIVREFFSSRTPSERPLSRDWVKYSREGERIFREGEEVSALFGRTAPLFDSYVREAREKGIEFGNVGELYRKLGFSYEQALLAEIDRFSAIKPGLSSHELKRLAEENLARYGITPK